MHPKGLREWERLQTFDWGCMWDVWSWESDHYLARSNLAPEMMATNKVLLKYEMQEILYSSHGKPFFLVGYVGLCGQSCQRTVLGCLLFFSVAGRSANLKMRMRPNTAIAQYHRCKKTLINFKPLQDSAAKFNASLDYLPAHQERPHWTDNSHRFSGCTWATSIFYRSLEQLNTSLLLVGSIISTSGDPSLTFAHLCHGALWSCIWPRWCWNMMKKSETLRQTHTTWIGYTVYEGVCCFINTHVNIGW